jgi:hypothetical protein
MADKEKTLTTNQLIVVLFIFTLFIIIGFMIDDSNLRISYMLSVGLALFTGINFFLTIKYYTKLRNMAGEQGPRGLKGDDGPRGDPGVCTFSDKCGMNETECETLIYNYIVENNYYGSGFTEELLRNPEKEFLNTNNLPIYSSELIESAKALKPLIQEKIKKCMATKKDKTKLLNDLFPPIENQ